MSAGARTCPWRLHAVLLACWFVASFGVVFFAREGDAWLSGVPFVFWWAAQGSVIVFVTIVAVFAWRANRRDRYAAGGVTTITVPQDRIVHQRFGMYVAGLLSFVLVLALAERWGLARAWVAGILLGGTVLMYAVIGVLGRTTDADEYYVAGRRIPAVYNGMAIAADWMSAASFISLAGGLYLQGFSGTASQPGGLAYIMGWTGGFCLVALLVAPNLRALNLYTVPDYFSVRFGGKWPRLIAAWATVLCSFTYVVAQLYGVGIITSRLTGVHFEIGIMLGLGGVLVCSFLGGMRAVTWTQVTQYVLMILAFLIPVSWLAYKQVGNPMAPVAYVQQLEKITALENRILASPTEQSVSAEFARRATVLQNKLTHVELALQQEREGLRQQLRILTDKGDETQLLELRRALAAVPKDVPTATQRWTQELAENTQRAQALGGIPPHSQAFAGDPNGTPPEQETYQTSRLNFLALMFCLMVGTAGLPHLLTRAYTTRSVAQTRTSLAWSVLFIALLYVSAPALAVLVKYEVMAHVVGQPIDQLPAWMAAWARDSSLLSFSDVNGDRLLQWGELKMGADVVMLATPEIGGLPYVVSALVAAGGLAAALSTADGLLLTMGNALAHDIHFQGDSQKASSMRGVMGSKFALLVLALLAAYVAAQRPAGILNLVSASFSLAACALVPVMVLGIFWKRTTRKGAVAGMLAGLGITLAYMAMNVPALRHYWGWHGSGLWWGIQPVSAGVFGVALGFLTTWAVSWADSWRQTSSRL
jgi:cation/acetate symporter